MNSENINLNTNNQNKYEKEEKIDLNDLVQDINKAMPEIENNNELLELKTS